jgi:hypothetical protein
MTLPFADARILADSARAQALELGKALSIAVVDYGGFVVLVERMDGARPMTPGSPDEDQKICEDVLRAAGFELDFPEWAGARRH